MLRYPRTTQELRFNQEEWGRPCRNHIPTSYDDLFRASNKSWKCYRNQQWKIKENKTKKDSSSYGYSMSTRCHWHYQHKWCKRRRCASCIKNDIWDDSWYDLRDREIELENERRKIDFEKSKIVIKRHG